MLRWATDTLRKAPWMNFRQWCFTKTIKQFIHLMRAIRYLRGDSKRNARKLVAWRFQRICIRSCSVNTTSASELDSWSILESIRAHSRSFFDRMFKFMGKLSTHFADVTMTTDMQCTSSCKDVSLPTVKKQRVTTLHASRAIWSLNSYQVWSR